LQFNAGGRYRVDACTAAGDRFLDDQELSIF